MISQSQIEQKSKDIISANKMISDICKNNLNNVDMNFYQSQLKYIIQLQSICRGYIARKLVQRIKENLNSRENEQANKITANKESLQNERSISCDKIQNENGKDKENERRNENENESKLEYMDHYTFKNGACYKGQWKNNMRNGYGVNIWPDNAKFEGFWKNNKANGKGTFYHTNGDVIEGNWIDDKLSGFGTYIHKSGQKYEGMWVDDVQHGFGIESYLDE